MSMFYFPDGGLGIKFTPSFMLTMLSHADIMFLTIRYTKPHRKGNKMTKLEMAHYVTDTLYMNHLKSRTVPFTHWHVKKLMKGSKAGLFDHYIRAVKAREATYRNNSILRSHNDTRRT